MLSQIAAQVAVEEGAGVADVKSAMLEGIAHALARFAARASSRRQLRPRPLPASLVGWDLPPWPDSEDEIGDISPARAETG